jgi:hypothetical protein
MTFFVKKLSQKAFSSVRVRQDLDNNLNQRQQKSTALVAKAEDSDAGKDVFFCFLSVVFEKHDPKFSNVALLGVLVFINIYFRCFFFFNRIFFFLKLPNDGTNICWKKNDGDRWPNVHLGAEKLTL